KEEMRVRVRAGERVLNLERGLADRNRELKGINEQLKTAFEHIETDLKAAAWMQANLLPSASPKTLNVASEWRFRPSGWVAGDIFNVFQLDDHRVGFYLLDVSGHGVPAAMLSVTLSMVLSPNSSQGSPLKRYNPSTLVDELVPPDGVVTDLNQRFQGKDDQYFTIIYGVLDSKTGDVALTQAGHPNPVLFAQGCELRMLGDGGPPVGLFPDMEYETIHARLKPGDRILLYSDGVTECANQDGELFGEERLMSYLRLSREQPLARFLDGLESEMERWRGSQAFEDDVSLLALELTALQQERL
ncbi:MAG: PP2C family protein-serine/threonine phosphatase, partial [Bryobacteraceae bacterium]